jgi:hypothetical protein
MAEFTTSPIYPQDKSCQSRSFGTGHKQRQSRACIISIVSGAQTKVAESMASCSVTIEGYICACFACIWEEQRMMVQKRCGEDCEYSLKDVRMGLKNLACGR